MTNLVNEVSLEIALKHLADNQSQILSGGTDYYPSLNDAPPHQSLLSTHRIAGLNTIICHDDHWRIGAAVTWSAMINDASLPSSFNCLKQAGREVGSIQIQNTATLAGNICNASPAADGVPALLVLDAHVELSSVDGIRVLPLSEFIVGVRKTALQANEMVTAILIPKKLDSDDSDFVKLGARTYLVISIVMCAVRIRVNNDNVITDTAIAVGACSPVGLRLTSLEQSLVGLHCHCDAIANIVLPEHLNTLSPIADVRASAEYRLHATRVLIQRQLNAFAHAATREGSA